MRNPPCPDRQTDNLKAGGIRELGQSPRGSLTDSFRRKGDSNLQSPSRVPLSQRADGPLEPSQKHPPPLRGTEGSNPVCSTGESRARRGARVGSSRSSFDFSQVPRSPEPRPAFPDVRDQRR